MEGGESRGVRKVDVRARVSGFGFRVLVLGFRISGFGGSSRKMN